MSAPVGKATTDERKLTRHYLASLPDDALDPAVEELFEKYSGVPKDKVKQHVEKVRDVAWDIFPYCCVGRFTFLDLSIRLALEYRDVLRRVKAGEKYLDVGCCFGQDIRKLVYDGAPAENLYGTDLESSFFSLGHELFNDGEKLQTKFIATDMTKPDDTALDQLGGTISIIHASSFFHLFDWATQVQCAKRCVKLLRHEKGSFIFGRQGASDEPKERDHPFRDSKIYNHNAESWQRMWDEVGVATGTKWRTVVELRGEPDLEEQGRFGGSRRMRYACYLE